MILLRIALGLLLASALVADIMIYAPCTSDAECEYETAN